MFEKGKSGNPKGRPVGSGVTGKLRSAIEARAPELIEMLIQKALEGDTASAKFLLDRVLPAVKSVEVTELTPPPKPKPRDPDKVLRDVRKRFFGLDDTG